MCDCLKFFGRVEINKLLITVLRLLQTEDPKSMTEVPMIMAEGPKRMTDDLKSMTEIPTRLTEDSASLHHHKLIKQLPITFMVQ